MKEYARRLPCGSPLEFARIHDGHSLSPTAQGLFTGGAVGQTQTLITTGKIRLTMRWNADGTRAARYRGGTWCFLGLPPPDKNWGGCHADVAARPKTDEFILLRICSAPDRALAYALYRFTSDADAFVHIPFDNKVVRPCPRAPRSFPHLRTFLSIMAMPAFGEKLMKSRNGFARTTLCAIPTTLPRAAPPRWSSPSSASATSAPPTWRACSRASMRRGSATKGPAPTTSRARRVR